MNLEELKSRYEKEFGITIDNLEVKDLENGNKLIAFYDPRLGRKRLIDYNNSSELIMLDVEYLKANYDDLIKRIPAGSEHKVAMFNNLLNQADSRGYKYISFENMTALDSNGNVVFTSLNRENEVQVGMANGYQATINRSVEENPVTSEDTSSIDTKQLPNDGNSIVAEDANFPDNTFTDDQDFKKVVQEEMKKHNIQGDLGEEYNKVISYSNDLSKLEFDYENKLIDDNHYDFYKVSSEAYINSKSLEKINSRSLVYKNDSGFVSVLIIAYIAIMVSILALLLINL